MKIGISMPHSGFLTERHNISSISSKADVLGFDFLTVSDHIVIPKYVNSKMPYASDGTFDPGDGFCYDPLILLSFLSAVTEKIRLVPSVMVVPYRNPIYAAKMISTIDVLSSGRITIGCGVGWLKEEFEVLDAHNFHSRGIVTNEESFMAKDALKWAAMTYVVVALQSLATLIYFLSIFLRRR